MTEQIKVKKSKKKANQETIRNRRLIAIFSSIFVVCACVVGFMMLGNNNEQPTKKADPASSEVQKEETIEAKSNAVTTGIVQPK